jgi:spore coat protein U-like protein
VNTPPKTLRMPSLRTLVALACVAGSAGLHAAGVSCIVNSLALVFPIYDASDPSPTNSMGSVDVQCTNFDANPTTGVGVSVGISAGSNGSVSDRKFAGSGGLLSYGVYQDAARTINWGQGMDAVQQSSGAMTAGQSKILHYTLFGSIPAHQNVPAGIYQDLLVLTITP